MEQRISNLKTMITDEYIKEKVNDISNKISALRLNKKIKQFQLIDLPFITIKYRTEPIKVSRKQIRLYLDLIETWFPLYSRSDNKTKADFISEIFKCKCNETDLLNLKQFKKITIKEVLTMENDNVKTIKRLRWRSPNNVHRNYIHSKT